MDTRFTTWNQIHWHGHGRLTRASPIDPADPTTPTPQSSPQ
jgi:hypothetical protein